MLLMMPLMLVASMAFAQTNSATVSPKAEKHMKKDGTPDKRYKDNKEEHSAKHMKKDGTPDKRYKENKKG